MCGRVGTRNGMLSRVPDISDDAVFKSVQRLQLGLFVPLDISPEPPRQPCASLIGDELASRYRKDVIEFFQASLLEDVSMQSTARWSQYTFVSGTHKKIQTKAIMFNAAKNPNAPVGVNALRILGNVNPSTAAQNRQVATAQPMPTSR